MPARPDAANPDLLDRIPLTARVVLDVGCHTGALGAAFKRRAPAARVWGIEADPGAAAIAATRLDRLAQLDVEAVPVPFDDAPVDCLVYGDVLEHLRDPWAVLARQVAAMAPDGVVLACVPSMEHWSFAARLLRGDWDYEAQGLFDRTHLRWFTPAMVRAALDAAGLTVLDVAGRVFDAPQADTFARALRPALDRLGIAPAAYARRAAPLQYVWRAVRRKPAPVFVRTTMLPPIGGVSALRVEQPARALATIPGVHVAAAPDDMAALPMAGDDPAVIVLHRPLLAGEAGLARVRAMLARGWLVVTEFDDHPAGIPVMRRPDNHTFTAVHAVQASTEPLAAVLRAENPEVAVFPNAVDALPEPANYRPGAPLTVLCAAINREAEWPALLPVLNEVAARAGDRLRFQVVADPALFEGLATPHKRYLPLCDYPTYKRLLAAAELCLMPLSDTPFNRCKSDLKFLEAAAHRVTAVASPVVYGASIQDGATGLIFRDPGELRLHLTRLVADPARGRALAEAARNWVAGRRMLAAQLEPRLAWYRDLWHRREALTRALLARVPALGV